jgi:hypothetical protein
MNSATKIYLNEFYENPKNIEEYKINFLKNNFYEKINKFLECDIKNLKIGVTKNKNTIWFKDIKNENKEVIYFYNEERLFIKNNLLKKIEEINM